MDFPPVRIRCMFLPLIVTPWLSFWQSPGPEIRSLKPFDLSVLALLPPFNKRQPILFDIYPPLDPIGRSISVFFGLLIGSHAHQKSLHLRAKSAFWRGGWLTNVTHHGSWILLGFLATSREFFFPGRRGGPGWKNTLLNRAHAR